MSKSKNKHVHNCAPMLTMGGVDPESVAVMRDAVLQILNTKADQKTLQIALKIFGARFGKVEHVTISDCTFQNLETPSAGK